MKEIVLIVHNVRSTHNVGSLLRTADGLGVAQVYLSGFTPYPIVKNDERLPHLAKKINSQIAKTALGAEKTVNVTHIDKPKLLFQHLQAQGYVICALEQTSKSTDITKFKPPKKVALVVGREVGGLEAEILKLCDEVLEIPMLGQKESFNVAVATAMALFHIRLGK